VVSSIRLDLVGRFTRRYFRTGVSLSVRSGPALAAPGLCEFGSAGTPEGGDETNRCRRRSCS
jgi:hypothetical protein